MRFPKCTSSNLVKFGIRRFRKRGIPTDIQYYHCKDCGWSGYKIIEE
jgi:transposase-like protein